MTSSTPPDGSGSVSVHEQHALSVFRACAAQLYTQDFYRSVVEPKLAPGGIFVTQSGPAGVLSCGEVFAPINHTLTSVFPRVVPYAQHIPSYVDTWVRPRSPTQKLSKPLTCPPGPSGRRLSVLMHVWAHIPPQDPAAVGTGGRALPQCCACTLVH